MKKWVSSMGMRSRVMRSGQYAADRAQQESRRRGRARALAADLNELTDGRQEYVDELASLLANTGMSRMASRVFAGLITSPTGTLTAAELVSELRVSPASVSKAIGYLERMELVQRQPEPRSRRERYSVGDDIWTRAIRADSSGHAAVAATAQRGLTLFGADTPTGIRLARMGQFFGNLTQQLRGSELADPGIDDALTVVAALGHAQHPMTATQLATALGWPQSRLGDAISQLRRHPTLGDPFIVSEADSGYSLRPRPERLSVEPRAAL